MAELGAVWAYLRDHWIDLAFRVGTAGVIVLVARFSGRSLSRWVARLIERSSRRSHTLASIVSTALRATVIGGGIVLALSQLGFDLRAFLAGAGVVGLAVGFGAQWLIKDVIAGFFLIFDGSLARGDIVTVGDVTGEVEAVGLRISKVRAFDGRLWCMQNGEIQRVGSYSRGWTRAVVSVGVDYAADVAASVEILQQVGDSWAGESAGIALQRPQALGVIGASATHVELQLSVRVTPPHHWSAERELRARVKLAFEIAHIDMRFLSDTSPAPLV